MTESQFEQADGPLLACVGPAGDGEQLVRRAADMARQAGLAWHAVYVETPRLQRIASAQRQRILETLKLAERLGAVTAVLAGSDSAALLADYAIERQASRIVLGRARRAPWRRPHLMRIGARAPAIELTELAAGAARPGAAPTQRARGP
ncbi:MAG: two-component system sensor histidine kinase KdbD, partial [Pseudomonadota bacterium]|nr:two-component system sensor histidine kinase KdbD [Pseudomonadota bacterium]